jgi:methylene-tetrahydromethanopterin dehydrogenase
MEKASILHLFTAAKNASPFDINMAYDAGFDKIVTYTNVELAEVAGLTQDAIFSRSPSGVKREGIFIGGRDIDLAMQMLNTAKKSMFAPFACSVFADPSGAFTTAAAIIAKIEAHLTAKFNEDLSGKTLSVFGATGPVGGCAAISAAQQGANVQVVAHNSVARIEAKAAHWNSEYQINLQVVDGSTDAKKTAILAQAEIVISAAAAGVQVITQPQLMLAKRLKIVVDVNAVAPNGVQGVDANHDGVIIAGTQIYGTQIYGIGAMAIGQLKYATQHQLLKQMLRLEQDKPNYLEFMAAFNLARELSKNPS